jgi:hypothetical protein
MNRKKLAIAFIGLIALVTAIDWTAPERFLQFRWVQGSQVILTILLIATISQTGNPQFRQLGGSLAQRRILIRLGSLLLVLSLFWLLGSVVFFSENPTAFGLTQGTNVLFVIFPFLLLAAVGASMLVYWVLLRLMD